MSSAAVKLTAPHFSLLVNTLDNTSHPLGDLCHHLWESPLSSTPSLSIATTLAALLQDNLLPRPPQRLIAIYILYDMIVSRHSTPSSSLLDRLIDSPFTIILLDLISTSDRRLPEHLFLNHLFSQPHSSSNTDLPMIGQISNAAANALYAALQNTIRSGTMLATRNIASLTRLWTERHSNTPPPVPLTPVSAVVPDPIQIPNESSHLADQLAHVVSLHDFSPVFVRPPPPFLPVPTQNHGLRAIHPEPLHQIIWDPDIEVNTDRGTQLREIISRAIKSPISEIQRVQVLNELADDPKLVYACGLTPSNIADLVNNNSKLAIEILLRLANSNQMPQYLDALVRMDMNMNSMEVVSCLSSKVKLPTDFMHTYISNCIRSCANIPDRYGQIRMVRFVCVFLKTLMKNKAIEVQDLYIEVQLQHFCIEYSRIREVAELYRSLKSDSAVQL